MRWRTITGPQPPAIPEPPVLAVLAIGLLVALFVLGRSFGHWGWERWMHITTGCWVFYATVALALRLIDDEVYNWLAGSPLMRTVDEP